MKIQGHFTRLILIAVLLAGALGVVPVARATTGCTMYVSTTADGNTADFALTLREATQIGQRRYRSVGVGTIVIIRRTGESTRVYVGRQP